MANRRKSNKKPGKGGKIALCVFSALLLALAGLSGVGVLNAGIVRIRRAEVILPDLPPAFDGATVLYASDIDLCGINTAEKSGELFHQLQSLSPDLLILGGDYASSTLLEVLNRRGGEDGNHSEKLRERTDFFHYISSFYAPMGKFAIASPEDPEKENLRQLMQQCGVRPLFNDRTAIRAGSDALWIAGITEETAGLNAAGNAFSRGDCVLVVAYSPTVLPILLTSEASDGGHWADLALCGHTHGGQIRLFGRSALSLDSREQSFPSGWRVSTGFPILVTEGVGCEGINLRLGTQPEVWLITLRKA